MKLNGGGRVGDTPPPSSTIPPNDGGVNEWEWGGVWVTHAAPRCRQKFGERRRRRRSPAPPPLPVSPPSACIPSHPPSVTSSLVPFAMTWHRGLGSLSSLLAGDDMAAGRWAVTQKGGWWWASGDVAVRMVVVGIEWGVGIEQSGDVAAVAVEMGQSSSS